MQNAVHSHSHFLNLFAVGARRVVGDTGARSDQCERAARDGVAEDSGRSESKEEAVGWGAFRQGETRLDFQRNKFVVVGLLGRLDLFNGVIIGFAIIPTIKFKTRNKYGLIHLN